MPAPAAAEKHLDRVAPPRDSEEHARILQHAMERVASAEDVHRRMIPQWQENYRSFRALPTRGMPRKKEDWQSDVRTPYVAEQVLTMLPRLVEGRPNVDVLRQDPNVSPEVARAQRQYLNHVLWQDGFPLKASREALNTIIFGTAWSKQGYLHTTKMRDVMERMTGRVHEVPVVTANRSTSNPGHPFDVMADPAAPTLEQGRFFVWRTISTVKQLKANRRRRVRTPEGLDRFAGRYDNTEDVKPFGRDPREHTLANEVPDYVRPRCKDGTVEILEILDVEIDHLIVVANRNTVIRCQRFPWWHGQAPVSCAVTTPDVAVLQGIAEVDWMLPLQEMLHKLENQRLDNQRLQMDLVLLIRDTVMDMDDYQLGPGAKWPVQNPDDVSVLQYPQPQLASIQDMEMLRGRMQAIIGSAYQTGGDPGAMGMNQETASGLLAIIEEGNRRVDFRMNLMTIHQERKLQQMLSNGAQFLEDPIYVPGAGRGQDPIPVSPQELSAASWVRVKLGNDTGMKSLRQQMAQNMAQVAQMLVGTPVPTPEGLRQFNPYPMIEAFADAYDKDPEEWLYDAQAFAATQPAQVDPAAALQQQTQQQAPTQVSMMGAGMPTAA